MPARVGAFPPKFFEKIHKLQRCCFRLASDESRSLLPDHGNQNRAASTPLQGDYFMPVVQITLIEGRTDEQKQAMYREVTDAIERTLGAQRENIRIMIYDVPRTDFAVAGVSKSAQDLKSGG
jgi:4-oxalocrotonate tautomerase